MPTLQLIPNPHNILCIELFINKEKHLFVVDTGATFSHIRESLVFGLSDKETKPVKTIGINHEKCSVRVRQPFNFCGVSLSNIMLDQYLTKTTEYSGLIGQDILRQFSRVVVDYVRSTITFEK